MENNEEIKVNATEVNANENKPKKDNNGKTVILIVIVLILVLAIGIGGGFLLANKDNNNTVNTNETQNNGKEQTKSSKKIDENKPWVYDAEYGKNYSEKRVEPEYTYDVYASTNKLKAPYININSEDANKANSEIKKIYEEYYAMFGKNAGSDYLFYIPNMKYLYYENNNILSVVMIHYPMITGTSYGEYNIKTYNFNLDTLKFATFDEVSKIGGYTRTDIDTAIEKLNNVQDGPDGKLEFKDIFLAKDGKMYAVCIGGTDSGGKRNPNFNTVINLSTGKDEFIGYTLFNEDTNKSDSKDESKKNDNSATNSIQDFSIMKETGFANTVYENEKKQGEKFYRVSFDSNCNPTIYIEDVGAQPYATYKNFYNLKYDKTAGTKYIDFDFKILNETEEGGKGQIQYVNTSDIIIKLNYPPTDYVTLRKVATSNNKIATETDKNYVEEYIKIIDKFVQEDPNNQITYDLIYFNNDDIPDLVIGVQGYWVSLYIYEDGKIYNPVDDWPYGIGGSKYYDYMEKKGVVFNYGNEFAGAIGYSTYYLLNSKREFDEFIIISKGADLEPTDSMYEEVQKKLAERAGYYYNDKKISEEEFNNKLKESSVSTYGKEYKALTGNKTAEEVKKQLQ